MSRGHGSSTVAPSFSVATGKAESIAAFGKLRTFGKEADTSSEEREKGSQKPCDLCPGLQRMGPTKQPGRAEPFLTPRLCVGLSPLACAYSHVGQGERGKRKTPASQPLAQERLRPRVVVEPIWSRLTIMSCGGSQAKAPTPCLLPCPLCTHLPLPAFTPLCAESRLAHPGCQPLEPGARFQPRLSHWSAQFSCFPPSASHPGGASYVSPRHTHTPAPQEHGSVPS